MTTLDTELLNELIQRYKAFKKPTDMQKLIVLLGEKQEKDRTDDENKKLTVLLNAEKKLAALNKARSKARKIVDAEKETARKAETRKKIVWGAALKKAAQNSPEMAQVMRKLYSGGYVSESDKAAVKSDFDAFGDDTVSVPTHNNNNLF